MPLLRRWPADSAHQLAIRVEGGFHDERDFVGCVARIPVRVLRNLGVAKMAALGVPGVGIAVVAARIAAVPGGKRKARRPHLWHVMGGFNPSAQPSQVGQRLPVLGQVREPHELDLHGGVAVCLTPPASLRSARPPSAVSMCWNMLLPSTVKCGSDRFRAKAFIAPCAVLPSVV